MKTGRISVGLCAVCVSLLLTATASAGLIVDLTYANDPAIQSGVPDGSVFATVQINSVSSNSVKFTVDANTSVLSPGGNFGIQKFAFDYDSAAVGSITLSDLPAGWSVVEDAAGGGGFGKFEIVSQGSGSTRVDPLTFTITTSKSPANIEQAFYEENSLGYHFAAHIAGFKSINGSTSGYFTDGVPVPELATMLLFSTGVAGIFALRKSRRKVRIA
jgi:hypothetical protein